MTGRALVVQANAMPRPDGRGGLPLPDVSVHLCVTSPPYWRKRKYAITGPGEIGNEPNWQLYLENLWTVTDELLRVLHPSGSIWVNLGDTRVTGTGPEWLGIPVKSRLLLPERYRIGCQDRYAAQDVIVRQVQIHDKANGLPESTTDRTRDSHEDWVHIVKRPSYYSALDALREPYSPEASQRRTLYGQNPGRDGLAGLRATGVAQHGSNGVSVMGVGGQAENPLGKIPGSVWRIPSDPLQLPAWLGVDHYAAFSPEWPRRLVLAFSSPGICCECGEGRRPVVDRRFKLDHMQNNRRHRMDVEDNGERGDHNLYGGRVKATGTQQARILGWACACTPYTDHPERRRPSVTQQNGQKLNDQQAWEQYGGRQHGNDWPERLPVREYHLDGWRVPPTRPSVVLDPFGGTGTTAMVARALGRIGISIDLSHSYSRAARWRCLDGGEWQQVIERTTGRPTKPLPKHNPDQERLAW